MIWTILFTVGCVAAMIAVYRAYLPFRDEIRKLPPAAGSAGLPHPLLGASLKTAVDLPAGVLGRAAVVQFAAPTCPKCHEEMMLLEKAYKEHPFPYVCLYEVDEKTDEQLVREFIAEFGHLNVMPLPAATARKMGVNMTPLVMMIDADGIVRRVEFRLKKMLEWMPKAERRAG